MNIVARKPRAALTNLQSDMGELFKRFFGEEEFGTHLPEAFRTSRMPAVDVAEGEKEMTFSFELPGLEEKDINVEIMGNQLVVSGERKWEEKKKNKELHRVETQYGAFHRSLLLPQGLRTNPNDITASYKKGILEITIPKVEPTPTSRIKVTTS